MKINLSRIEKSIILSLTSIIAGGLVGLLAGGTAGSITTLAVLALGLAWAWRPQGRDAKTGRFTFKPILLLAALLIVGCQGKTMAPTAPGTITHRKDAQHWQFTAPQPAAPIVVTIPAPGQAAAPAVVVILPQAAAVPTALDETHEESQVVQPENPAAAGTVQSGPEGTTVTIPPSYKPADPPAPATPAEKALGGLVWLGAALVVLGVLGVGLRFLPWTAALGAVVPIGVSVLVALSGGLLIAYATVLATAPWWVTGLCIAGVVAIGFLVAMRDNWKLLARKPAETTPAVAPPLVT